MDETTKRYRIEQFNKVRTKSSVYPIILKIHDENGSTNYLDITLKEFTAIKKLLTKSLTEADKVKLNGQY